MVPHSKANVLVTTPADAATGALSAVADGTTGADLYGIRAESVAALHYVLLGQEFEPDGIDYTLLAGHQEVFVYNELHGGWLYCFPDDVVRWIAEIPEGERRLVAERWSRIFATDGKPPTLDEVERMVEQLVILAQTALRQHKSMYWLQEGC